MQSTNKPLVTIGLVLVLILGGVLMFQLATSPITNVPPVSQVAQVSVPTSGLVGYWNFDGSASDSAGGNNGSIVSGASFTDSGRSGFGQALSVSGGSYVNVPGAVYSPSAGTLALWVKSNGGGVITGSYNDSPKSRTPTLALNGTGSQKVGWEFSDKINQSSTGTVSAGSWNHLALVYSGGNVSLYINGALDTSTTASAATAFYNQVHIGHYANYGNSYFNGLIDDVRIYNRALSASEIQQIYSYTGAPTTPPPPPPPPADTTAPAISGMSASGLTVSSAVISWSTNEAADGQVEYGLTSSYGSQTALDSTMGTSHSQSLSGLTADTVYHFRVKSKDAAGNLATSGDGTFTTVKPADTTAPSVPSNLTSSNITQTGATVSWMASSDNVAITGYKIFRNGVQVAAINATSYQDNSLSANTTYTYSVSAYDAAGNNSAMSAVLSVKTLVPAKFKAGDRVSVVVKPSLRVRSTAYLSDASILGTQVLGAQGTIVNGPTTASGYTWWNINYDTAPDGWSIEGDASGSFLALATTPPPPPPPSTYTVTVSKAGTGSGTVTCNPASCGTTVGSSVVLTATPASGSSFTGWSGACSGTGSCTVSSASTVTATFTTIVVANVPPTVSLNPIAQSSLVAPATIALSAVASDSDGTVSSVQFYRGGTTLIGAGVKQGTTNSYTYSWSGVAAGTYSVTAKATDNSGAVTTSSSVSVVVNPAVVADTAAPTVPSGLVATAVSSSQINLSWTSSIDNTAVTGYKVFRDGLQIANITPAVTTFQNTSGLSAATAYSYKVSAYDAAGNESAPSVAVSATTQAAPVSTGTIFVKPGGSLATAWSQVVAGGTICVAGGTYASGFDVTKSGTASQRITVKRATAGDPVCGSGASGWGGWQSSYDSQVVINGSGSNITFSTYGVGSYVTIDGVVADGIKLNVPNNGASGVNFLRGGQKSIELMHMDIAGPAGSTAFTFGGDGRGIDLTAWSGSAWEYIDGVTISNNRVHGLPNLLYFAHVTNSLIENNQLYDSWAANSATYHENVLLTLESSNIVFRNNTISNWATEGIEMGYTHSNWWIYGNTWTAGAAGPYRRALETQYQPSDNIYVYNNTFNGLWLVAYNDNSGGAFNSSIMTNNTFNNSPLGNANFATSGTIPAVPAFAGGGGSVTTPPPTTPPPAPTPSTKFSLNQKVITNAVDNVRQTAGGTLLGTQAAGAIGTVIGGPTSAALNGVTYWWWSVSFSTGVSGWVGEDGLDAYTPPVVVTPAPTVSLTGPSSIISGQSANLTWSSTNATSCTGTGGTFAGIKAISGTQAVTPTSNTAYSITCTGAGGTSLVASATVTVTAAVVVTPPTGTYYVRLGATGNGSDWTNALGSLPTTLTRGATYYIAGGTGNYGSYSFSTPESGTQLITVKKATVLDHGTSIGWSDVYGTAPANFSTWNFNTGYWNIDGQTGGGPGNWNSGHGFSLYSTSGILIYFNGSVSNIAIRHTKADSNRGSTFIAGLKSTTGTVSNITISYDQFSNIFGPIFHIGNWSNSTIEYSYLYNNLSTAAMHSEGISSIGTNDNLTIRYNLWDKVDGTAIFAGVNSGASTNWKIYGNIFSRSVTTLYYYDEAGTTNHQSMNGMEFYNNVVTGINGISQGGILIQNGSNNKVYNNIWYNNDAAAFGISGTKNSNYFSKNIRTADCTPACNKDSEGASGDPNAQITSINPFVNWASGMDPLNADFTLVSATNNGVALPVPYNVDMKGKIRGADGVWDRGALELGSTGPVVVTPAPTVSLTGPSSIISGQSANLTWSSTNATSCTGTGGTFAGIKAISGTQAVTPTSNTAYSITCTGAGGTSPVSSVTVSVTAPSTKFSLNQKVITNAVDNVRQTAAGTILGTQSLGIVGTVIGGPVSATLNGITYWWWSVSFGTAPSGWVAEDGLDAYVAPVVDTTSPSIPSGVTATVNSSSAITLGWNAASDNTGVAGYNIYRNNVLTPIATVTGTSYQNTGLIAGTLYSYAVSAIDTAGNESARSASVSATTQAAVVVTPPPPITGSVVYVKQGGTGNGSDWTNALGNLPGTLVRGTTYYVAAGSYGSKTFNTPVSGSSPIIIKKASATDHGTEVGWSSCAGCGTGQAVFSGFTFNGTGYITIDGGYEYGIQIYVASQGSVGIGFDSAINNLTLMNTEIRGLGGSTNYPWNKETRGIDATPSSGMSNNFTVSHVSIHGFPTLFQIAHANTVLVEYTKLYDSLCGGTGSDCANAVHPNVFYADDTSNVTFRYNELSNWGNMGVYPVLGTSNNWEIANNVFRDAGGTGYPYAFSIELDPGKSISNLYIHDNIFANVYQGISLRGTVNGGSVTNNKYYKIYGGNNYGGLPNSNNVTVTTSPI